MMQRRWYALGLAVFVGLLTIALVLRWAHRTPEETVIRSALGSKSASGVEPGIVDSLVAVLVRKAPFRWSRRAVMISASPVTGASAPGPSAPPTPPKPLLSLAGIVWGRHPLAVLEGVPGAAEPRVVAQGDSAGGLLVRLVARDRVVVIGFDTLWTLKLKVSWP